MNRFIDYTLLKPDATSKAIELLCQEALLHRFAAVCILPTWVSLAARLLDKSPVNVCSVVGFPLGSNTLNTKQFEAADLVSLGANEIDMVMNIGAFKSQDFHKVEQEIQAVVNAAAPSIVKVIIETCLLSDEEKLTACRLAENGGAHFVKTSTGFSSGGATLHDVALIRKTVSPHMQVKASGGIRDAATAAAMIEAGASRIGTSSCFAAPY